MLRAIERRGKMYFITTIYIKNKEVETERTIGMYSSEEYARGNVERNVHDMFEKGYYNYAVISKMGYGTYQTPEIIGWYYYDVRTKEVTECETPEEMEKYYPYIIG